MPTPPPLWIETHDAPAAVFSRAFNSGQSATASEPSFMLSVSRNGDATEPQSRWSRPITIGALIFPFFTRSFMARPNVRGHETGKVVRVLHAALESKGADVVAIVERH